MGRNENTPVAANNRGADRNANRVHLQSQYSSPRLQLMVIDSTARRDGTLALVTVAGARVGDCIQIPAFEIPARSA